MKVRKTLLVAAAGWTGLAAQAVAQIPVRGDHSASDDHLAKARYQQGPERGVQAKNLRHAARPTH